MTNLFTILTLLIIALISKWAIDALIEFLIQTRYVQRKILKNRPHPINMIRRLR